MTAILGPAPSVGQFRLGERVARATRASARLGCQRTCACGRALGTVVRPASWCGVVLKLADPGGSPRAVVDQTQGQGGNPGGQEHGSAYDVARAHPQVRDDCADEVQHESGGRESSQ